MNWHKLAKYVDDINTLNGFDKPTWDNLPVKVMMVITELDELETAYTGAHSVVWQRDPEIYTGREVDVDVAKIGNMDEEIADVSIRLLSLLHSVWGDSWPRPTRSWQNWGNGMGDGPKLLWPIVHLLSEGVEFWRYDNRKKTKLCLSKALSKAWSLADSWGFDLKKLVQKKADINKERGHLHGKVRSAG